MELIEVDEYALLTTYEDFEMYLPGFCRYIIKQAEEREQTLEEYLATRQLDPSKLHEPAEGKKLPDLAYLSFRIRFKDTEKSQPGIRSVPIKKLQLAAAWMRLQTWDFVRRMHRMRDMTPLIDAAQDAAMPDPEKLDRLMRYQTTINRQLSSAMGELLELTKRG